VTTEPILIDNNLAKAENLSQADVDAYLRDYEMGARNGGIKRPTEEVIREAVVWDLIRAAAKAANKKLPKPEDKARVIAAMYEANKAKVDKEVTRRLKAAAVTDEVVSVDW